MYNTVIQCEPCANCYVHRKPDTNSLKRFTLLNNTQHVYKTNHSLLSALCPVGHQVPDMRIKYYQIKRCRHPLGVRGTWHSRSVEARLLDSPETLVLYASNRSADKNNNLVVMKSWIRHLYLTSFNINILSDHQCLLVLIFKTSDVGRLCTLINWVCVTPRIENQCCPLMETCMVFHRLVTTSRWSDLDKTFASFITDVRNTVGVCRTILRSIWVCSGASWGVFAVACRFFQKIHWRLLFTFGQFFRFHLL